MKIPTYVWLILVAVLFFGIGFGAKAMSVNKGTATK